MKKGFLILIITLSGSLLINYNAQNKLNKVEPPHWWTDMNNDTLHLLFYGEAIDVQEVSCKREDVKISSFKSSENGKYLFLDLLLKESKAGIIPLKIKSGKKTLHWSYTLKERDKQTPLGLNQSDLIYLLMPDRFSSGNDSNDSMEDMNQHGVYRDSLYERHGGDLEGIINNIHYIQELGISALWLNPVEVNDQIHESYHGYAISNHYTVDPRLGTNNDYANLIKEGHNRDIKMIRDVVFNHFGDQHPLIKDLPDSSWINNWANYTRTTFRATTQLDPHASERDKYIFSNGWFDHHMPDMNYKNKDLANYMIQNSIWWVEEFKVDAYRIDTYIYPDQDFMKRWAKELKEEYPEIFLFSETWVHGSAIQAWFAGGDRLDQGETYIDGVTDFQMYYAINNALNNPYGWNSGISEVYYKLVDDVLYKYPENNVLFLDNHDLDRFYGNIGQDWSKFKIGIGLLFTLRGIPSIFYGTEILMPYKGEHGIIRTDFPGGWKSDTINKFNAEGRNDQENLAFNYIKQLANWRKNSPAIATGTLIQFVPKENQYVFARVSDEEVVLVVVNQGDKKIELDLKNYDEVLNGMRKYHLVLEHLSYNESDKVLILANSIQILSFQSNGNKNSINSPRNSN